MRDIINSCRQIAEVGTEIASPLGVSDVDTLPSSLANTTDPNKQQSGMWTFWRALLPGNYSCVTEPNNYVTLCFYPQQAPNGKRAISVSYI